MKKIVIALLLLSQVSLFAQDYKFGKVSKEELEEKFYPLDSTADAAYLYRSRRTYFDSTSENFFQLVTEIHERIKIYTKEGFEMANKSISYYNPDNGSDESVTSIKGYTYSLVNGKIEKEKLSKKNVFTEKRNKFYSVKKITMPNIKEGIIIEIKYKLISPYATSISDFQFQYGIPVKKIKYKVEIPEYYTFNKKAKGYFFITPSQNSKRGEIKYEYKERGAYNKETKYSGTIDYLINIDEYIADNIPALKDNEPFISSVNNYRGGMKFELTQTNFISIGGKIKNYSTSWKVVSKQVFKSPDFGTELNKSSYYKDDLEKILTVAKTNSDKVAAIFQHVKNQVKWNGFYGKYTDKGVRKAYKERVGNSADINLMLTSMLRSAGLEANPVLVSTRKNGVPLFPTIKGFNYVVSMVEFPDGSYALLDATEKYSLPNILPVRDLNWNGRKVTKDGNSSWVKLTSSKPALEENYLMATITDDLIVEGMYRTKYNNLNALTYRKNNNHIKEEDLITKLEEKNKIEIEDYKLVSKEKIGKPIVRTVKFLSEDLVEQINGKIYIEPLLFFSTHTNPFKLEDRKFPVDFTTPWKDKNTVSIKIPEGYKVETLPEPLAIGLPENLGVFKFQTSTAGNKINTICIIQFNSAIIAPQYYTVLKDFYGQMVKKQSEKIVLVKM